MFDGPPAWFTPEIPVMTAGSCFAQNIGRRMKKYGYSIIDTEPPPSFLAESNWARFGYDLYSARYGNIYSSRQMLELIEESLSQRSINTTTWLDSHGRHYDPLRPNVSPGGLSTAEMVFRSRAIHLECVRQALITAEALIFTLGLTEIWTDQETARVVPSAPGTLAGDVRCNPADWSRLSVEDVTDDLLSIDRLLRDLKPTFQMLVTVSPVPLNATASGEHVAVATQHSKATLRVAVDAAKEQSHSISYFPSYEIVTNPPAGTNYFMKDGRNVSSRGIDAVMSHMFPGVQTLPESSRSADLDEERDGGLICDEESWV
jgi:hypothetical protein